MAEVKKDKVIDLEMPLYGMILISMATGILMGTAMGLQRGMKLKKS